MTFDVWLVLLMHGVHVWSRVRHACTLVDVHAPLMWAGRQ